MEKIDDKRNSLSASLNSDARPPSYVEQAPRQEPPPDLSARLAQLDLNPINLAGSTATPQINVTPDQCTAHLKLLEAFNQLREDIGNTDGLFGINSPTFNEKEEKSEKSPQKGQDMHALAEVRVREKRWAVFVARAVDRFEKWWDTCVPATLQGSPCEKLTSKVICEKKDLQNIALTGNAIVQLGARDHLPPIGMYSSI
jgi:hypothetical protein